MHYIIKIKGDKMFYLLMCLAWGNSDQVLNSINIEKYKKERTWLKKETIPDIVLCTKNVKKIKLVKQAKKVWAQKGEKLGKIKFGSKDDCKYYYIRDAIVVSDPNRNINLRKEYACTVNLVNKKKIKASHIELSREIDLHIITHELGHALGYDHNQIRNDLMNKEY